MELTLIFGISIVGLLFALYLIRDVMKRDSGTEKMQTISHAIRQGAEAFLRRQNKTIAMLAVALALLIYILYAFVRAHNEHDPASTADLALWTTLSFVLGAACSVAAGYMGMWVAIRSNIRTASGATKDMNSALQPALRGGAVSGFFVVAVSLLGVAGLFAAVKSLGVAADVTKIPLLIDATKDPNPETNKSKYAAAAEYLKKAVQLNAKDCEAVLWAAQAFQNSNNKDEAKRYYHKVLDGGCPKQAEDARKWLKVLGEE